MIIQLLKNLGGNTGRDKGKTLGGKGGRDKGRGNQKSKSFKKMGILQLF